MRDTKSLKRKKKSFSVFFCVTRSLRSKLKIIKSPSKKSVKRLLSKDLKAINRLVKNKLKTPKQHLDNSIDHQRGRTLQRHIHKTATCKTNRQS